MFDKRGLVCRPLTLDDFISVNQIAQEHLSSTFRWPTELLSETFSQSQVFGVFKEDTLIAFAILSKLNENLFEIPCLATRLGQQGGGIMYGLLKWLFASLPAQSEIWLEAHEDNQNACKLYKKLGFTQSGKRPKYYSDGRAAILFTKHL